MQILKESPNTKYLRYRVVTAPYKNGLTKIDVTDNYFDKSDYAFVDLATGEVKSYSDIALKYVIKVLSYAKMSMYDVKPQASYIFYTEPHSNKVIDVEVSEAATASQPSQPKSEVVVATENDVKRLGFDLNEFVLENKELGVSAIDAYYVGMCADISSALIGYKTDQGVFGYYDPDSGYTRHDIPEKSMTYQLKADAEMAWEEANKN